MRSNSDLDPTLGLRPAIIIPADLRQAPLPLQLDPEHATHVPAQRYQELYQMFGFARSYIARLYLELHERDLEIGRLWRHQSCQSSAVARLQMEVDRLRTRLEVEGFLWIPPRMRRMMMMALRPTMLHHLHPLLPGKQQLVPAGGDISWPSPF
ncbi:hypothetical protein JCGZ_02790 [Jatropha curcas]|uniref:Uncharacterized protein n=1 Tax=Jatropha curcas TaxID=180498 RepID=A0A067JIQ1_JATCU|nr:hypothetical protein JCGZ_02790 [Jatropha curcas]